jgi:hypothetical protein
MERTTRSLLELQVFCELALRHGAETASDMMGKARSVGISDRIFDCDEFDSEGHLDLAAIEIGADRVTSALRELFPHITAPRDRGGS